MSKNLSLSMEQVNEITNNSDSINSKRAMTPRLEIMMKREAKRKEEEEHLTFKPKINTTSSTITQSTTGLGSKRFDLLYEDAKKRKELLSDKVNHSIDKDLTFKPTINSRSRSSSRNRNNKDDDTQSISSNSSSVHDRLYQSSKVTSTNTSLIQTPTFKPQITKRASSLDRSNSISSETTERLYILSKTNKDKHEQFINNETLKLSKELTFQPKINKKSRDLSNSRSSKTDGDIPVHERLLKYEETKTKKLELAREEKLKQELAEATFTPSIISSPNVTISSPNKNVNVFEKLSKPNNKDKDIALKLAEMESDLFKPHIYSKRSASPSIKSPDGENVHDRLFKQAEQKKIELEKERLEREAEIMKDVTFSPAINTYTPTTTDADKNTTVFNRLSTNKSYIQDVLKKLKEENDLSECTFKPDLSSSQNKLGVQVNRNHGEDIYTRLNAEAERLKIEHKKREEERLIEEMKDVTFKPNLVASDRYSTPSRGSDPVYIRLNAEADKHRIEQQKREELKLQEELKEATFTPNIPKSSSNLIQRKSSYNMLTASSQLRQVEKVDKSKRISISSKSISSKNVNKTVKQDDDDDDDLENVHVSDITPIVNELDINNLIIETKNSNSKVVKSVTTPSNKSFSLKSPSSTKSTSNSSKIQSNQSTVNKIKSTKVSDDDINKSITSPSNVITTSTGSTIVFRTANSSKSTPSTINPISSNSNKKTITSSTIKNRNASTTTNTTINTTIDPVIESSTVIDESKYVEVEDDINEIVDSSLVTSTINNEIEEVDINNESSNDN